MNPNPQNVGQNSGTFTYPAIGGTSQSDPNATAQSSVNTPTSLPQVQPTQLDPMTSSDATLQTPPVSPPAMGVPQVPVDNQISPVQDPVITANDSAVAQSDTSGDENSTENVGPLEALANKLNNLKDEFIGEASQETVDNGSLPAADSSQSDSPTESSVSPMTSDNILSNNATLPPVAPETTSTSVSPAVPAPITQVSSIPVVNEISTSTPFNPSDMLSKTAPTSPVPVAPLGASTELNKAEDSGKSLEEILKEESDQETPKVSGESYQYTIEQLLDLVVERDASDLHITVGYPVMIRVDGALQNVSEQIVTPDQANELILPVLPEQKKELLEVNREVDLAYAHGENARFRINAYYQKQTLAGAFRLIPNRIRSIDELKLPQIYHQIAKLKQGLVLVTGPTGSGKSTTLASILQEINMTRPDHMITIEDPIEYVFPKAMAMVDQREMHEDTHSWEIALKSALRQDPDVMLVGEMRDFETIASAITLAETGHLVFATLHTNSASQTVDRIIDVFPEHQQPQIRAQLSHVIEAVIAQRLIPLPSGGRMAVSEIMLANPAVRNLIREAKTHQLDNVIRTSADIGMVSLEHSLVKLVRENVITMDLAQEYAVHPEEVVRLLKS